MSVMFREASPPVAKKKAVSTVQVRVAQDVADLAAIVAAYRRKQTSDLLSDILRPILQKLHAEEMSRAAAETLPPKKGKP